MLLALEEHGSVRFDFVGCVDAAPPTANHSTWLVTVGEAVGTVEVPEKPSPFAHWCDPATAVMSDSGPAMEGPQ